jgi:signal transduction histidine kinase
MVMYDRLRGELDRGLDATLRARSTDIVVLMHDTRGPGAIGRLPSSDETIAQVLDTRGHVLGATRSLVGMSALTRSQLARALRRPTFIDHPQLRGTDETLRLFARAITIGGASRVIVVGATLEGRSEALAGVRREFLIGLPVAIVLAVAGAFIVASAALRPVRALRTGAEAITQTRPGTRLVEPNTRDEIGELARTLNSMLARLAAAGERERRFVADVSHELRGPLALVQSELEVTLAGPHRVEPYRRALEAAEREVAGLAQLANDLLLLARADEEHLQLRRESISPHAVLLGAKLRFSRRAQAAGRPLRIGTTDDRPVEVDRLRIEQAIGNLVENALRHGQGEITLAAHRAPDSIRWSVRDEGPGFRDDFKQHAFERFSRADPARSGHGAGLGLAIVDLIARAHDGRPYIQQGSAGCEVGLWLPVTPADAER